VQDYLVALRASKWLDDGTVFLGKFFVLLKVFLILNPSHEYVRSLLAFGNSLMYWKKHRNTLPFWNMFKKQPNLFDGEQGEVMFGVMSRVVIKDTLKNNLDHMSRKFTLTTPFVQGNKKLKAILGTGKEKKTGMLVDVDDEEVQRSKAWLQGFVNKVSHNMASIYVSSNAYADAHTGASFSTDPKKYNNRTRRLYQKGCLHIVDEVLAKCEKETVNNWARETPGITDVWKELEPLHNMPDEVDAREAMPNDALDGEDMSRELEIVKGGNGGQVVLKNKAQKSKGGKGLGKKRAKKASFNQAMDDEEEEESVGDGNGKSGKGERREEKSPPAKERFKNNLATSDGEKALFETMCMEWCENNGKKKVSKAAWHDLGEKAALQYFVSQGGDASKRRVRPVRSEFVQSLYESAMQDEEDEEQQSDEGDVEEDAEEELEDNFDDENDSGVEMID
jgi:hypothetical protein